MTMFRRLAVRCCLTGVFALLTLGFARAETITLIAENDWYPYSALKGHAPRGFAVDVVRAAYHAVHIDVKFNSAPYVRCLEETKLGLALGCFDSLKDAKLSQDFLFHQVPLFKAEIGIYVDAGKAKAHMNVQGLKGHRVVLTHGYTYGTEFEMEKDIQREVAPTDLSNLRKLLRGRSEYSLVYTRIVDFLETTYPNEFKGKIQQVGIATVDNLFVSFSKSRPEAQKYADLLDEGLRLIQSNGVYKSLEEQWKTPAF